MPRHLKKTAIKPTSGMPQTKQFGASDGVLLSKDVLIAAQFLERSERFSQNDFICRHNGIASVLFGRTLFWDDKCDQCFVEDAMVRVS